MSCERHAVLVACPLEPWPTTDFLDCFLFRDTASTETYTLSLHDALPIFRARAQLVPAVRATREHGRLRAGSPQRGRSEEHTSELQSLRHLVCRLLLEKEKLRRDIRGISNSVIYEYLTQSPPSVMEPGSDP